MLQIGVVTRPGGDLHPHGGSGPPLAALVVQRRSATPEAEVAAWVLAGLGARVWASSPCRSPFTTPPLAGSRRKPRPDVVLGQPGDPPTDCPAAVVDATAPPVDAGGVPEGTLAYATGLALAAAALAAARSGGRVSVSSLDVALQVYLPPVMAASYRAPTWPAPPAPVPAPGGGFTNCELGAPGAGDDFRRLLSTLPVGATAAELAAAAQDWRLAVCEYRRRPPAGDDPLVHGFSGPAGRATTPPGRRDLRADAGQPAPLTGVSVCDLTSMWAGPLATWLLGRLGADIVKVEPACRLDGTRALDGRGIHPEGRSRRPGNDSALHNALNSGKKRVDLDLADGSARRQLLELISGVDVVIDSFSPRVMPNLGLHRQAIAGPGDRRITVSIPAFPEGPRRGWVAYGTGVHAVSGLGHCPDGSFRAPSVTYPDPVAGLAACVAVLAGIVGRERGWQPVHLEVPLLSAVQPLLRFGPAPGRLTGGRADDGRRLLRAGVDAGAMDTVEDGAGRHLYPSGPFRGDGLPLPLAPAPCLDVVPAG